VKRRILCIDPGLGGTGWSHWADDFNVRSDAAKTAWRLVDSGAFTPKGASLQDEVADLCKHVIALLRSYVLVEGVHSATVAVEHPQFFQGASATNASGALVKLSMAAGAALAATAGFQNASPLLVPLSWKGNLPKELCCERIKERMRRDTRYRGWCGRTSTTHEIDAVGIGLFLQGRF
jgi:Holliday junction resolvasome RuvABC endonuclease subunit